MSFRYFSSSMEVPLNVSGEAIPNPGLQAIGWSRLVWQLPLPLKCTAKSGPVPGPFAGPDCGNSSSGDGRIDGKTTRAVVEHLDRVIARGDDPFEQCRVR